MTQHKMLVVEDDMGLCSQYRWSFDGCDISFAHSRQQAAAVIRKALPSVVLLDLGLPPDADGVSEGFATLREVLLASPDAKVIIVSGNGERPHALKAISMGASDFCEKPIDLELLQTIVARNLKIYELEIENRRLAALVAPSPVKRIVTGSPEMLKVCLDIERLARTNVPVLLLGESGTGKEALANALHDMGPRAGRPFIAINCGAIPENLLESELFGHERGSFTGAIRQTIGKIEVANGGTLFLDEVGDLPHILQVKLLRFLQDHIIERIGGRTKIQVDVRIVSATNANLEDKISQGEFREDLFYRMNAITVRIPPLRDRTGDSILLANFFLSRFNQEFSRNIRGFTEAATIAIARHPWPGNVRELENRVKRAVIMTDGKLIDIADLELGIAVQQRLDLDLRGARMRAEREVIQSALLLSNNTLTSASKMLGISRPTLYGLMETHGLNVGIQKTADDDATTTNAAG
jgi:two-component system, NtrC family, response regulator